MLFKRDITENIDQGSQYFPVVAILGPRQSGKTTLARSMFNNHTYISLEDLDARTAAQQDPRTFLIANSSKYGLIIDEFQYVPHLLSYIQTMVDMDQKPGYFILTGSQNFLMNQAITQSLAGRVSIHTLLPLSINELKEHNVLPNHIEEMIHTGCYPAIYAKGIPADLLYKNYIQTYIERDVRELAQVGDLATFQTLITLCAARTGQLLNITSLANDCGISNQTAERWLSILQTSYIIFLLQPYHTNIGKREVKTPKLYFYDTGLACYLLKIKAEELASHPNKGNLFESLIISESFKYHYNHGITPTIYFWRDKIGHEVDCIIKHGQQLISVEVKAGRTVSQRFLEGLDYWNNYTKMPQDNGFIVFGGDAKQVRIHPYIVSWQSMQEIFNLIS